jgi:hypothetical protein
LNVSTAHGTRHVAAPGARFGGQGNADQAAKACALETTALTVA